MKMPDVEKPPYRVPSMAEIQAIPWNGYNVTSTFSGCGGSCLGYRMAGYKVLWANEFVPAAQETYIANKAADCILDARDIKAVSAEDILQATGLKEGELDLLDGSPPCQAFSTAGKREKGWGKEKSYKHGAKQCNEQLFMEYIRLLQGLQPKVFVAENVSGLLKGVAKGIFLEILKGLKDSGYQVKCKLLDAQWLSVPQTRQRAIFIGVRDDLPIEPVFPKPLPYNYSVVEAIPWIQDMVIDPHGQFAVINSHGELPCDTITTHNGDHLSVSDRHRSGGFSNTECTHRPAPTITATQCSMDIEQGVSIKGQVIEKEWEKLKPGEHSKRYFNLSKAHPNKPHDCILQSHGTAGIASPTHPYQRRKLSIPELKRICAFPDDFILTGSYAQQWARLGDSVPPIMMCHIGTTIRDQILSKCKG